MLLVINCFGVCRIQLISRNQKAVSPEAQLYHPIAPSTSA